MGSCKLDNDGVHIQKVKFFDFDNQKFANCFCIDFSVMGPLDDQSNYDGPSMVRQSLLPTACILMSFWILFNSTF